MDQIRYLTFHAPVILSSVTLGQAPFFLLILFVIAYLNQVIIFNERAIFVHYYIKRWQSPIGKKQSFPEACSQKRERLKVHE